MTIYEQKVVTFFLVCEDEVDEEDDEASTILSPLGMFRNFRTIFIASLDSNSWGYINVDF